MPGEEALVGEGGEVVAHHDLAPASPRRTLAVAVTDTDGARYVVELVPPAADTEAHPGGTIQEEAIRSTLEVGAEVVAVRDQSKHSVAAGGVTAEAGGRRTELTTTSFSVNGGSLEVT